MCCGQRCDTYANFNFRIKEEEKWVIAASREILKALGFDDRFSACLVRHGFILGWER